MGLFVKIVNGFLPLTFFSKKFDLCDVREGSSICLWEVSFKRSSARKRIWSRKETQISHQRKEKIKRFTLINRKSFLEFLAFSILQFTLFYVENIVNITHIQILYVIIVNKNTQTRQDEQVQFVEKNHKMFCKNNEKYENSEMMTWQITCTRSCHRRSPIKKGVLKNFAKSAGNHLCQSLFFNKAADPRPATILKRDSNTVHLWALLLQYCNLKVH